MSDKNRILSTKTLKINVGTTLISGKGGLSYSIAKMNLPENYSTNSIITHDIAVLSVSIAPGSIKKLKTTIWGFIFDNHTASTVNQRTITLLFAPIELVDCGLKEPLQFLFVLLGQSY